MAKILTVSRKSITPLRPSYNECCFVNNFPVPIKSCNVIQKSQAEWTDLFQSDFIKHLWLHILQIILIGYEKVHFQRGWYDK